MSTLRIAPELTIYGAAELRELLVTSLAGQHSGATFTLDLADVCEVDSAGVQLLIAARRQAAATGVNLVLANHSAVLLDTLALLGFCAEAHPLEASLS